MVGEVDWCGSRHHCGEVDLDSTLFVQAILNIVENITRISFVTILAEVGEGYGTLLLVDCVAPQHLVKSN